VIKGNGVRDCQLGTVRSRLTTYDRTQPEAYLHSYSLNTAFKCIYSLIIRQPPIYNVAGCLCCRLPTMQQAPCAAAGSQQCSRLPVLQQAPNKWRCRTRLPMLLDYNNATCSLCCTSSSMLQPANMWRYRTASGSLRQCCCLASGSLYAAPMLPSLALCCRLPTVAIPHCKWLPTAMLHEAPSKLRLPTCGSLYAAPMLLAVKLPAVNCAPNNCQPSLPTEKAACRSCCLPTDRTLYTAAVRPCLCCRLTGPVQLITARRLLASAAAQPMRPLPLCTCKQLERYTPNPKPATFPLNSVPLGSQESR
jgi:hypothetical protein